MFKTLTTWLTNALKAVVLLLPDSPFIFLEKSTWMPNEVKEILKYLNWFIPVSTILSLLEMWLSAIIVYYGLQVILRWVKAIE